jgi:3-isopropylmalate/(R)-2-methylmalate dehydratase small subunit
VKPLVGRCAVVLGDDVNTDVIYPGKHLKISDPREMAQHALEGIREDLWREIRPGDMLVAGENFGCGSSRTQSVACLRALGVQAVVARSFARSFYRNSINQGLPAIACTSCRGIAAGEELSIDFDAHTVTTSHGEFVFEPYPPLLLAIMERGGLVALGKEIVRGAYALE